MSSLYRIAASIFTALFCIVLAAQADAAPTETDGLRIDAQYPGGNIIVDRIEGDQVYLRQDLRDTKGWWFYWNFRVRGAASRTLRFTFDGQSPIGVRGPAVSTDGGCEWTWLGADGAQGASFTYRFDPGTDGPILLRHTLPGRTSAAISGSLSGQPFPLGPNTVQDSQGTGRRTLGGRRSGW